MIAVIQRVSSAAVTVDEKTVGSIERGLTVLLGVAREDTEEDSRILAEKTVSLRIFRDEKDRMNLSLADVGGAVLVVSQFTLLGDCRKGRRPSFTAAAPPEQAERLYESFCRILRGKGLRVETGVFGAMMQVRIHNDGPVTLILDSARLRAPRRGAPATGEGEPA